MIQYRKANVSDYEGITTLLLQEKLPVEDIDKGLPHFFVATANERIIGSIGLEVFGTVGLLRSMVVDPAFRGMGIAVELVNRLRAESDALNIQDLFLITNTAERFFRNRGFQTIPRDIVPEPIRHTREFSELCPASSAVMVLS